MPQPPILPGRSRFPPGYPPRIGVPMPPPRPTPTASLVPARNAQGFTPEEAAKVEARGQELYDAMRAADIETAAHARAAQLYKALVGKDAPTTEAAVAAPVAG